MKNLKNLFLVFISFLYSFSVLAEVAKDAACVENMAHLAVTSKSTKEVGHFAKLSFACAKSCLEKNSEEARCHYYRAVSRGRLLEEGLVQPKDNIPLMVADFEKTLALDPKFDQAGAYRALALVYLKLPALPIWGNSYYKDLDKAVSFAKESVKLAPTPENYRALGEVALEKKEFRLAYSSFKKALSLTRDHDQQSKKEIAQLKSLVKKTTSRLN